MQKAAPSKSPKPQPQPPHPRPLRKGDTAAPPSPSRTPRVGTAALAAYVGLGIHSPAEAGTRQESPRQGRLALQGIWGARTSPSGGFYCPRIPLLAHSSFARRVFLTEWMTQDSREPNCATVYLTTPPSCADGWKSSRCTRGGVGAGSSLLSRPVDRCKQFRGSPSISQYLNALLQLNPPPKHGSVTEKGLLVQVFGLIQTFPIGKTRAPNAAVHSLSYFPWSGDSAERLSLHASMLRAPECLYRSRNVHERPHFCHQRERGHKLTRRTPSALSAGRSPVGPRRERKRAPAGGRFAVCKGVWGSEPGPARALGEGASDAPREGRRTHRTSRTSTRRRPRSRRPCAGPRRRRRPTPPSRRPTASSFRIFCPERLLR